MVNEEIQQIITNVQTYQNGVKYQNFSWNYSTSHSLWYPVTKDVTQIIIQACNAVTVLLEVKGQLNRLEDCLRDLQKKADEVVSMAKYYATDDMC